MGRTLIGPGFQVAPEAEARILMLIDRFSRGRNVLEGRTKLAKLDFFLRYPAYLRLALEIRGIPVPDDLGLEAPDIESRMVRYRFGPWDPAYFTILGRLLGKGLVIPVPFNRGLGYRATDEGRRVVSQVRDEDTWAEVARRVDLIHRGLDLSGTTLKNFVYANFPEISSATWGERL